MFEFYYDSTFTGGSTNSWIPLLALLVSLASILFSFYLLYLNKRVDVLNTKFQKFCISQIDLIFDKLSAKLQDETISEGGMRRTITNMSVELQIFLLALKDIYPQIDLNKLTTVCENFSDEIYKTEILDIEVIKLQFMRFKLNMYSALYDYALTKELNLLHRLKRKRQSVSQS
jgi:hypothetical protein